ncbi:hypothetical protein CEUSTIGMA_g12072.t1 [Chlamydomonas eustigma]|uniref:Methyltransferase domain-containing protein n=1 Tax=Chlamydomonas eustigma TaxID=1157962 RepID=A0A250XNI5_9CHLO|nr:hypothetical protein CEUSTIGMA_g12072.t1 [Chlamydomonas eustigma]|eukprot:GAX84651.1 hypothetical protein CEUSTIGMA_g12072.t1 [Chlamydomonas eustigma]
MANADTDVGKSICDARESLQKDLDFIKRLHLSASTLDGYVGAARSAAKVAARASKQLRTLLSVNEVIITVRNIPETYDWSKVKDFLQGLGITSLRVEKSSSWQLAVVHLPHNVDKEEVITKLNGQILEGIELKAELGVPENDEMRDPQMLDRCSKKLKTNLKPKRSHMRAAVLAAAKSAPTCVCSVVCPWWKVSYDEQLMQKFALLENTLRTVSKKQDKAGQAVCPTGTSSSLLGMLKSPMISGYRNKSEMSIGIDAAGSIEVGFLMGASADGITIIASPSPTPHTSSMAKAYATVVRDYLRSQRSVLPPWDKRRVPSNGFWRSITVREGHSCFHPSTAAALPSTTLCPSEVWNTNLYHAFFVTADRLQLQEQTKESDCIQPDSYDQDQMYLLTQPYEAVLVTIQVNDKFTHHSLMMSEVSAMAKHIRDEAFRRGLRLTSVLLQLHSGQGNKVPSTAPLIVLEGESVGLKEEEATQQILSPPYLVYNMCGLTLRSSYTSYQQVNSGAASLLATLVSEWLAECPQHSINPITAEARSGSLGVQHTSLSEVVASVSVPHNTVIQSTLSSGGHLVLDLYCGVGTLGLALSPRADVIIGVDSEPSAVEDAVYNAHMNGRPTCTYILGKVEGVLENTLSQLAGGYDIVTVIVDSPRSGLGEAVIQILKSFQCRAMRLLYVSTHLDTLQEDVAGLCDTTLNLLPPEGKQKHVSRTDMMSHFILVKSAGVDLFPHTSSFASVTLLQKMQNVAT